MEENNKGEIEVTKDGPYVARNIKEFKNSQDEEIPAKESMVLCRCGQSEDKPFCDGTHIGAHFSGRKDADRTKDNPKTYSGKSLKIHDNRGVCAHVGYCTDNSPEVFDSSKKPWIDADGGEVEKTKKTIKMCPSGALHYTHEGQTWDGKACECTIKIHKDGPLCVSGSTKLIDNDGCQPELKKHYALCRCGKSKNKPFCDGTHWHAGFKDEKN